VEQQPASQESLCLAGLVIVITLLTAIAVITAAVLILHLLQEQGCVIVNDTNHYAII
jgi:hypothetical protein